MKNPDYPTQQPKSPVDDALIDRNSDPAATAQAEPIKKHAEALRESAQDNDRPLLEGSLKGERPRTDESDAAQRSNQK